MHRIRVQNIFLLFLSGMVLLSCTTAVKESWRDFTAYYNTYYNAKRSFKTGIEKVREQKVNINPEQPIRIHPAPVSAGQQEFKKAINKGAKILRKFPKSRWVDNALKLIGKSYYYRQEYFSAQQKFRELYATAKTPALKQEAVYWRGRIFLEMDLYSQGIRFLQNELNDLKNWKPVWKAEVQAVISELYSQLEQWESANAYLVKAIPRLKKDIHQARAYFLHGQVLERLGRLEEAYGAYSRVSQFHPPYELVYHARRKQAEVSRMAGRLERAYEIFVDMSKDDKNFEILPELKYQIARTLQKMGQNRRAERIYKRVLHDANQQPSPSTKAKTYYGLATLYRNAYGDFRTAAAYYDSSASVNVDRSKLPESFEAGRLAESFGEYASIKQRINKADSLLWLGSLPKAKFDSVLAEIKKKRRKQLEKLRDQQSQARTMISEKVYEKQSGEIEQKAGFLNYQNRKLVAEGKAQFQAYWGNRPLVDHWRRIEKLRQMKQSSDTALARNAKRNKGLGAGITLKDLRIDLSEIPFSEEAREKKRNQILKARYELANTFFLSLNMPDSAQFYYKNIIEQTPDTASIVPQALYSLSELHYSENDSSRARELAKRLIENYPQTEYARRMALRYGMKGKVREPQKSQTRRDSVYTSYRALLDTLKRKHSLARARGYQNFSEAYRGTPAATYALYMSARNYLKAFRHSQSARDTIQSEQIEKMLSGGTPDSKKLVSLRVKGSIINNTNPACDHPYVDSLRNVVRRLHQNYESVSLQMRHQQTVQSDSVYRCRDLRLEAQMDTKFSNYVRRFKKVVNGKAEASQLDSAGRRLLELRSDLNEALKTWSAEKIRKFALAHTDSRIAPYAMQRSARIYMKLGRSDSLYRARADKWFEAQAAYNQRKQNLQQQVDSVSALIQEKTGKNPSTGPAQGPSQLEREARRRNQNEPGEPRKAPRRGNRGRTPDRESGREPREEEPRTREQGPKKANQKQAVSDIKKLKNKLRMLQDSAVAEPNYEEVFPYIGAHWDSARAVVHQFTSRMKGTEVYEEMKHLQEELSVPEPLKQKWKRENAPADTAAADTLNQVSSDSLMAARQDTVSSPSADTTGSREVPQLKSTPADSVAKPLAGAGKEQKVPDTAGRMPKRGRDRAKPDKIYLCKKLKVDPEIKGGMGQFVKKIVYPRKVRQMSMSTEAPFWVTFDKDGKVIDANSVRTGTGLGINEAIEQAIEKHMRIKPVKHEQKPVAVKCKITVPVDLPVSE